MTCCKYIPVLIGAVIIFGLTYCNNNGETDNTTSIDTTQTAVTNGKTVFDQLCANCHNFNQNGIGPNLSGLTRIVPKDWIARFIKNPGVLINNKDERARKLYDQYHTYMPSFAFLADSVMENIISYLHTYTYIPTETQDASIKDPIPNKIPLAENPIKLTYAFQALPTAERPPLARINKMICSPTNRLFIQDIRGVLYEIRDKSLHPFLIIKEYFKDFIDQPGLGTGLGSYAFHPGFTENGLFYTSHTEPGGTLPADFSYNDSIKVTLQWIITEWKSTNPEAQSFKGSHRELLRIDFVSGIHGMQDLTFNPTVAHGHPDYGMLYVGLGDGGAVENGFPHIALHKGTGLWSSIIRIDPLGNNSKNGKYGIPLDNPFMNDDEKRNELWAYGFRNPNKISFRHDGVIFGTDIGQANIEEINVVRPGKFYGWPIREGTFKLNPFGNLSKVYPPDTSDVVEIEYPYFQMDHDESRAIIGGNFLYEGSNVTDRYIFGDIISGSVFTGNFLRNKPVVKRTNLLLEGQDFAFKEHFNGKRADLRFGCDCEGTTYLFTKADGKVYKLEPK